MLIDKCHAIINPLPNFMISPQARGYAIAVMDHQFIVMFFDLTNSRTGLLQRRWQQRLSFH